MLFKIRVSMGQMSAPMLVTTRPKKMMYISRRSPAYWPKSFFKNDPSLRMLGIGAVLQ